MKRLGSHRGRGNQVTEMVGSALLATATPGDSDGDHDNAKR
jgi:hypothetical protein